MVWFNPLLPNDNYSYRIIKISFSKKEGTKKKISDERRVYESVDDESLSKALSQNLTVRIKVSGINGLIRGSQC